MSLVRLHAAEDSIEAHLLRHMLEQQGIPCYITGEHLEGAVGELPTMGLIDVWVLGAQLDDALDVLDDFFDSLDGPCEDDEADGNSGTADRAAQDADEGPDPPPPPARDDPANPWNRVYRRK